MPTGEPELGVPSRGGSGRDFVSFPHPPPSFPCTLPHLALRQDERTCSLDISLPWQGLLLEYPPLSFFQTTNRKALQAEALFLFIWVSQLLASSWHRVWA